MQIPDYFKLQVIDRNEEVIQMYREALANTSDFAEFYIGNLFDIAPEKSTIVTQVDSRGNIIERQKDDFLERFGEKNQIRIKRKIQDENNGYLQLGKGLVIQTDSNYNPTILVLPVTTDEKYKSSEPSQLLASKALLATALLHNCYEVDKFNPITKIAMPGLGTGDDDAITPFKSALMFADGYRQVTRDLERILRTKSL